MKLLQVNWENAFIVVGFGFAMVLVILILLVLLLVLWEKILAFFTSLKRKKQKQELEKTRIDNRILREDFADPNDIAAISAAIYMYFSELHDSESNVITIESTDRYYSPWSSKVHGMKHLNK